MPKLHIDYTKLSYINKYIIMRDEKEIYRYVVEFIIDGVFIEKEFTGKEDVNDFIQESKFKIDKF